MSNRGESFGTRVLACVEDMNNVLQRLNRRYDNMVIVRALAERIGSALRILIQRKVCDADKARLLISHIEDAVFFTKGRPQWPGPAPKNTPPAYPSPGKN